MSRMYSCFVCLQQSLPPASNVLKANNPIEPEVKSVPETTPTQLTPTQLTPSQPSRERLPPVPVDAKSIEDDLKNIGADVVIPPAAITPPEQIFVSVVFT